MYHSVGFPEPFMVFDQVTFTVRTSDASAQLYLEPEVSLEG